MTLERPTIPASSFPSVKVTGRQRCARCSAHSHFSDLTALGEPRWRASACDMLFVLGRVNA